METGGQPSRIRVLLPGPSSYLGRRLLPRLLEDPAIAPRVLATSRKVLGEVAAGVADLVEGDPTDPEVLRRALQGIEVAFYPIGFVAADPEFDRLSRAFPDAFRDACIEAGVRRIIFLDSFPGTESAGTTLGARPDRLQTIWLESGFVLGSGSLLFEALRRPVQRLPVVPAPRWMETPVIAIGVRDLLDYLSAAIRVPLDRSVKVQVGLEPLRFREMLAATAGAMRLSRSILPVPVEARRISPYLLMLLSPFSTRLARRFLEAVAAQGRAAGTFSADRARALFPGITPAPFGTALARAIEAMAREEVVSRWSDSLGVDYRSDVGAEMARSVFRDVRRESFGRMPAERVFRAVSAIGGKRGWFRFTLLWRIRAMMDKLAGGFGDTVGRRDDTDLRVGDLLDVWRVIDIEPDRRLLLAAHMKTFGKAWLEFRIEGDTLIQTAYHDPAGLMGRLYWYSMLPFHAFIFPDMIRSILREARKESGR